MSGDLSSKRLLFCALSIVELIKSTNTNAIFFDYHFIIIWFIYKATDTSDKSSMKKLQVRLKHC
jgi:hypothetical protein